MKHKTKTKALSWLLSLALILSLVPGMSLTAFAATLDSSSTTWSEDSTINADTVTISGVVTVSTNMKLTIPKGKSLTVNGGIDAGNNTLTVAGSGTLVVNGSNGNDGASGTSGNGGNGGDGVTGNVTVTGGTVTINGGNGGNGGSGGRGSGGSGGNGGNGVTGDVKVTGGRVTIKGGNGGSRGLGETYGTAGSPGKAVLGKITGNAKESDNNSNWSDVNDSNSTKRYVEVLPAHNHSFTYIESANTITATCNADGCTLPSSSEGANDHVATLTIAAPQHTAVGDNKSADAQITDENQLKGSATVRYYATDTNSNKTGSALSSAPTDAGTYWAEITLGADSNTATAHTDPNPDKPEKSFQAA